MTTDNDHDFEENIARLMGAAVGPAARPSAEARERVRRRMMAQLRAMRPAPAFPVGILVTLAGLVALMGVLWTTHAFDVGVFEPIAALLHLPITLSLLLLSNVLWVPIAGAVIVTRNRRHVC